MNSFTSDPLPTVDANGSTITFPPVAVVLPFIKGRNVLNSIIFSVLQMCSFQSPNASFAEDTINILPVMNQQWYTLIWHYRVCALYRLYMYTVLKLATLGNFYETVLLSCHNINHESWHELYINKNICRFITDGDIPRQFL